MKNTGTRHSRRSTSASFSNTAESRSHHSQDVEQNLFYDSDVGEVYDSDRNNSTDIIDDDNIDVELDELAADPYADQDEGPEDVNEESRSAHTSGPSSETQDDDNMDIEDDEHENEHRFVSFGAYLCLSGV